MIPKPREKTRAKEGQESMKKLSCLLLALLLTLTPLAGGIVLPTAADDAAPKITPAPHAYAQGLAAWYAGEQNTRAGQNPESTVWEDLIGGYDMTVRTDAKTRFTAEGLALESSKQYFPQEVCGIVNGSAFTVEIRLGAFASVGDAYNTFMNSDNDNFALFRRNSNNVLEFKWAAVGAGQRPTVENGLSVLQDALVSITYEVGGEVVLYINGTRAAARDCTAAMGADNLFIGHVGNKAFRTTYRSLRFYRRALSAEEIRRNAAVDGYVDVKELYVQDGLVSLYSGIRNTRAGYNADAAVWEDLAGQQDITLNLNDKNYFTREGLRLNSQKHSFPQTIVNTVNGQAFTVEMSLGALTTLGHSFNTFINSTNDNFSLFRRVSNNVLEFKFAGNAAAERPTVQDGLEAFSGNLVAVTYEVGGKTVIYINGEKVAEAASPRAMGAEDLFFGHPDASRNYDTTFRAMRFYNRALTAEEIMKNAKADGSFSAKDTRPTSPGYVSVAQPRTGSVGDVALVRRVDSGTELDAVMSGVIKPAAVILRINSKLNITDADGREFLSLPVALDSLAWSVMPVFEPADAATVEPLVSYLKEIRFTDCFFLSKDAALVKAAREALPAVRGIIDYTEVYKGKTGLTQEECIELRKSMKRNNGTVALLPQSAARQETVQYLYDSIVNVWVCAADQPDGVGPLDGGLLDAGQRFDALFSGALGIVSDDTAGLYAAATSLPKKIMTRVPLNIGHRGLPDGNPENTVEGSLLAYEAGADVIENDVYLTADGQVVVMHDGTTGRTCNRNLSVTGSTLAELKELYVNRGFENVEGKNNWRIPTLEEYLIAFRGKDCRLFIELKSDQKGLVEAVRDLVNRYDMYAQVAVITFHESQMRTMREVWPEMSVGALCGGYLDETDSDADMRGVMNFIGKYNATLNPSYSGYGENAIRAALIRGIGVYPWTFVGSSYNQYFTWGYSGLTGNTAGVLNRHTKRLTLTGAADGDSVSVGEDLTLTLSAETYKRASADVTSNAGFVFLSGEELVSRRDGTLTFTGTGDVTFYVTYTNSRAKQTLATQPITLHVTDKSEETTVAPVTATEPGTSVTEPVSGTDSGTGIGTDPGTGIGGSETTASGGGCRSALAGSVLLALPALPVLPAVLAARRKRRQD